MGYERYRMIQIHGVKWGYRGIQGYPVLGYTRGKGGYRGIQGDTGDLPKKFCYICSFREITLIKVTTLEALNQTWFPV